MSLFYGGKLIVSRPLTDIKTPKYHFERAEELLIEGLKGGNNLRELRKRLLRFIARFSKESKYWRDIEMRSPKDRDVIFYTGLMLIKLQAIDPEGITEGILISKPKKGTLARRQ